MYERVRQTDKTPHDDTGRVYASHRAAKIFTNKRAQDCMHMMPSLQRVCNGLPRPADESILVQDIGTTGQQDILCLACCESILIL